MIKKPEWARNCEGGQDYVRTIPSIKECVEEIVDYLSKKDGCMLRWCVFTNGHPDVLFYELDNAVQFIKNNPEGKIERVVISVVDGY
jgi:hypothetical protein